jgi:phage tail protein X
MSTSYTTIQGDTWDIISLSQYGTEDEMDTLIAANPLYQYYRVFPAGVVLTIPYVDPTTTFSDLPPWRTGGTVSASGN